MFIAQKLKKENICEYLLYMWQTEDILRALQLNIDSVNETIVARYKDLNADERKQLLDWYESLMDMMRRENLQQTGHLQINKNTLSDLEEFHYQLLKTGKNPTYNAVFYALSNNLIELRKKSNQQKSDIEQCLNFMYGILLLKLRKTDISPQTLETKKEISGFLKLLADNYLLYSIGELTFDD